MGNRYILEVVCPKCGLMDCDVYYAPTCGFVSWSCPKCKNTVDLCEYTGITKEMASNAGTIKNLCANPKHLI